MIRFKSKVLTVVVGILLVIWQLPQLLVGLLMLLVFRKKEVYTNSRSGVIVWNVSSGKAFKTSCFSLGPIIVTCDGVYEDIVRHETGHSKQSIFLGWFYLLVVALPSIILFLYKKLNRKSEEWYLSMYPERWAERLGVTNRYIAREKREKD